ncbi:hypothetical protein J4573_02895 [Actinomadura barringtoniae]|uniref:Integral membrane protein n=1 Tax=Actinomadura barringtoniae TaxID=1427535 RepID=A0A939P605_9ACTN|nr:hypothetical protein [Actinomadura barringtoniae]MBO2446021.1 hypothetical protein [Actinomadura barringtoniae]
MPNPKSRGGRWRGIVAAVLIVVGCLLVPVSVLAVWSSNQVSDTGRYVDTVAPLASEPPVQNAIANRVTDAVTEQLDVPSAVNGAIDALEKQGLPAKLGERLSAVSGPVSEGVDGFVHDKTLQVVQSPAFAKVWTEVNRAAHQQIDRVLSGNGSDMLKTEGDTITVDLGPVVQLVKQQLVDAGLNVANAIPDVHPTYPIAQSDALVKAQRGYKLLNALGWIAPILALFLLAAGVFVARDRRRALVGAGLGVAIAMALLGAGLIVGRHVFLDQVADRAAGEAFYDTLVRFVRDGLRALLVLGLVVAAGAYLSGPSSTAVRVRTFFTRTLGRGDRGSTWVGGHKGLLRAAVVAVAVLALAFWDRPTGLVVLTLTLLVVIGLALIELLGRTDSGKPEAA